MESTLLRHVPKLLQRRSNSFHSYCSIRETAVISSSHHQCRSLCIAKRVATPTQTRRVPWSRSVRACNVAKSSQTPKIGATDPSSKANDVLFKLQLQLQLSRPVQARLQDRRNIFGLPAFPSYRKSDSYCTFTTFPNRSAATPTHSIQGLDKAVSKWKESRGSYEAFTETFAGIRIHSQAVDRTKNRFPFVHQFSAANQATLVDITSGGDDQVHYLNGPSKNRLWNPTLATAQTHKPRTSIVNLTHSRSFATLQRHILKFPHKRINLSRQSSEIYRQKSLMTSDSSKAAPETKTDVPTAHHRPLVVGLTKPSTPSNTMASSDAAAALNKEIEKNVKNNTKAAAPADESAESSQPKQKKEKAPKQPKQPKAAPAAAPTSPALIDLRVGHILRAIAHPNADSLYVSTIAMGDPEGTEHTQVDEETGKVVRTVCSGLNGLVPLAEMQDRKIIVVANLKPVNMRSIKSAAMVLAASPKQPEGADPHAPDRVVELVSPPEGSEAGDKVYFEGWPYGEGKGPEKQLNPKKKQWEAIQPGFYTTEDLKVAFDASKCDEVTGSEKGNLVVEGKGLCTVKTLKDAVVR